MFNTIKHFFFHCTQNLVEALLTWDLILLVWLEFVNMSKSSDVISPRLTLSVSIIRNPTEFTCSNPNSNYQRYIYIWLCVYSYWVGQHPIRSTDKIRMKQEQYRWSPQDCSCCLTLGKKKPHWVLEYLGGEEPWILSPLSLLTAMKAVKELLSPDCTLNSTTFSFTPPSSSTSSSSFPFSSEQIRVRAPSLWTVNLQTRERKKHRWSSFYISYFQKGLKEIITILS